MKHSTLVSITAAVSLTACHDAVAPEPRQQQLTPDAISAVIVDSSAAWAAAALDDAATRLLPSFAEGSTRSDLKRALSTLSAHITRGDDAAAHASKQAAERAIVQLRELNDVSSAPDLDAIALALDGAAALLVRRQNKE